MKDIVTYEADFPEHESKLSILEFFECYPEYCFLSLLECISEKISYAEEFRGCHFPDSFDEGECDYFTEGVMLFTNENEVIVDDKTFVQYLKVACDLYSRNHEEHREQVKQYMDRVEEQFLS